MFAAPAPGPHPQEAQPPPRDAWRSDRVRTLAEGQALLQRVVELMILAGFPERDIFSVRLAVEEAVVNAIRHGHRGDASKLVSIRYAVDANQVFAEIEDEGPGFDPDRLPNPLSPENLERPSGRGVFLMRHYMTSVQFNDRGNCVTLCKRKSA